jgi:DNA-directed RNA polymerase sigma subunit (sigma70/sigma32)
MKPVIKESDYLHTLDEIAETLNISRSTVGHAQRTALEKIRAALEKHGYAASDFLETCDE